MSTPTGVCGDCGKRTRVTKAGVLYKHPACDGGGTEPLVPRKTGFSDAQLEKMLSDLTPKRQKLRQAVRARVAGFVANVRNYFNGAWDVFDDE